MTDVQDDVLRELLFRLPPKSVLRFRCVSKRWDKIIEDPSFLRNYGDGRKGSPDRFLGFILHTDKYAFRNPGPRFSVPKIPILTVRGKKIGDIPENIGCFLSSSNGLVLCGRPFKMECYVINPLTNKWVSLPRPRYRYKFLIMGLVCEENTAQLVANFKVVRTGMPIMRPVNRITIETYSSTTGKWAESILVASDYFIIYGLKFITPLVLNGVFHWTVHKKVAIYDPNDIGRENYLQLIQLPIAHEYIHADTYSRSSDGLLWCGSLTEHGLKIWMLPKSDQGYIRDCTIPKEEWILVHEVTLDSLCNDYPSIRHAQSRHTSKIQSNIYSLFFSPWNPLIVLIRIRDSIHLYNIQSNSMESLSYYGQPSIDYDCYYFWHPHFESPFLSSYYLR